MSGLLVLGSFVLEWEARTTVGDAGEGEAYHNPRG